MFRVEDVFIQSGRCRLLSELEGPLFGPGHHEAFTPTSAAGISMDKYVWPRRDESSKSSRLDFADAAAEPASLYPEADGLAGE